MKALVLGGGSARGFAHIGVYKQLLKKSLKFDIITGTSMGGLVGAFIADNKSPEEIEDFVSQIKWIKIISRPGKGFFMTGESIFDIFDQHFGNRKIEDLPLKFACMAVDIDSGKQVVFDKGKICDALRSTMSLPCIFRPHEVKGRFLVDGGILCNLPVLQAEKMGAKKIIAINVQGPSKRKTKYREYMEAKSLSKCLKFGTPIFIDTFKKSVDIVINAQEIKDIGKLKVPCQVNNLSLEDVEYIDFLKWKKIVKMGENANLKII